MTVVDGKECRRWNIMNAVYRHRQSNEFGTHSLPFTINREMHAMLSTRIRNILDTLTPLSEFGTIDLMDLIELNDWLGLIESRFVFLFALKASSKLKTRKPNAKVWAVRTLQDSIFVLLVVIYAFKKEFH